MARISGTALRTPYGDADATLAALTVGGGATTPLVDLFDTLVALGREALAGASPDLVVLATTKADLPRWCDNVLAPGGGDGYGGPAWLATRLGEAFSAESFAVSAACASGTVALGVAARRIASGAKRRVLVLGGDRLGDFVREGFAALRALASDGCRPFDADRTGLTLGETAAAVVLDEHGTDHLQGWGARMDAHHLTGPDRNGAGLAAACRQALARGGVDAPALVIAHGTGTRYNDDAESLAYAAVCPNAPVTASKSLLGHSLGACGLADAVLAVHIRRRGVVPGIHTLNRRGCPGEIPLLGAGSHRVADGPVLVANAGFGGLNGAVLIGAQAPLALDLIAVAVSARAELDGVGWRCAERSAAWAEPAAGTSLPRLGAREVLGAIDASWGRMDLACRALVTLGRLLAPLPADCAIVLLSEHGCAATDRAFEQARRSGAVDPQRFAYTLPSTAVGEASIRLGLRGAGMALLGANDDQGRAVADELIAEGASAVLLARIEADRPPHLAWAELRTRA